MKVEFKEAYANVVYINLEVKIEGKAYQYHATLTGGRLESEEVYFIDTLDEPDDQDEIYQKIEEWLFAYPNSEPFTNLDLMLEKINVD